MRITLPYQMPDRMASNFTEYNEKAMRVQLIDGRHARMGIRRIERTATGSLLVRPRSAAVQRVHAGLGKAFYEAYGFEMLDKFFAGWCILPTEDGEEGWEFNWSYWAAGKDAAFAPPERRKLRDRAYWAVLATGMIAVRDRYDLGRDEWLARCNKAVEMGVVWSILIDLEHHDLLVFRPDDVERHTDIEGWSLPELPDVPFRQSWIAA